MFGTGSMSSTGTASSYSFLIFPPQVQSCDGSPGTCDRTDNTFNQDTGTESLDKNTKTVIAFKAVA